MQETENDFEEIPIYLFFDAFKKLYQSNKSKLSLQRATER